VWSRLISQSRIGAHRERAKAAAHFAVQRWLLGLDEALLTCALVEWRNAGIAEARSRKAARAHATVELAIDKWALGRHAGVLHRVVARWRQLRVAAAQEMVRKQQRAARAAQVGISLCRASSSSLLALSLSRWRSVRIARRRRATATSAVGLMLRKADKGPAPILAGWRQISAARVLARRTRLRTRECMERFLGGPTMHVMLLRWHYIVRLEGKQSEVSTRDSQIIRLDREIVKFMRLSETQFHGEEASFAGLMVVITFAYWQVLVHLSMRERLDVQVCRIAEENGILEDKLKMSYQQLDQVMATMLKELRGKEELAAELRNANVRSASELIPSTVSSLSSPMLRDIGRDTMGSARRRMQDRGAASSCTSTPGMPTSPLTMRGEDHSHLGELGLMPSSMACNWDAAAPLMLQELEQLHSDVDEVPGAAPQEPICTWDRVAPRLLRD